MKKKWKAIIGILSLFLILIAAGLAFVLSYGSFPGDIQIPQYQTVTEGVKTTFRKGVIYRYPGLIPLLEVAGNHYEMGLQYGVLLRPEIIESLKLYQQIIGWSAEEAGVPASLLTLVAKYKARQIAQKLPERFLQEIDGISAGSGVPRDTILTVTLLYDIGESMNCTSVLMKGSGNKIIHGRLNDSGFEGWFGRWTTVVRRKA